jgi:hypothetical protein
MTNPLPWVGPGPSPLNLYLRGERVAVAGIEDALRDAMADAQRRINKLETKNGIGSVVRRAQLFIIRRELRAVQEELWRAVNKNIRAASPTIANAAAEAERVLQALLFQAAGKRVSEALVSAQRAYAQRTVATYLARGENGIGLSERVYRTKQLANGLVDRAVNRAILQGAGWQQIAREVKPMIDPGTPGGVSYAAKRLARTELNNAFHTTQKASAEINPWVLGLRWHLSRSHTRPDKCDEILLGHSEGKPLGVYVPSELPRKPHPQCLCFTSNEMMDEDEFLRTVVDEEMLDEVVDEYREELPKAVGDDIVRLRPRTPPARPPAAGAQALSAAPISITSGKLNDEERSQLRQYKGVAYTPTNTYLRVGSGGFLRETVEKLDAILDKSRIKKDVLVFRGIKNPRSVLGDLVDGDLTGLEWIEEAPLSTSADKRVADVFAKDGGMVLRITVRKGAPMVKLSELGEQPSVGREAELLGGRGWKMKITKDNGLQGGVRVVDVEVVSHARNAQDPWERN